MKRAAVFIGALVLAQLTLGAPVFADGSGTPIDVVSYEDFQALSPDARLDMFNRLSPEGKARLFQAHIQAWLNANKSRLSEAQTAFITGSLLPLITADLYRQPLDEAKVAAVRNAEEAARQLFTAQDISAAFHLVGIHH